MVKIYIESGKSSKRDEKGRAVETNEWNFIDQYVRFLKPEWRIGADYEIVHVGGKDKLGSYANVMRENSDGGGVNLVVFDSDCVENGGGQAKRREELLLKRDEMGVDFDLFLFPNNRDDGDFESMLIEIVNPEHLGLLECFGKYERCIGRRNEEKGGDCYVTPNRKAKIYTYITSFRQHTNTERKSIANGDWDFCNGRYWVLSHPYMDNLRNFFLGYM